MKSIIFDYNLTLNDTKWLENAIHNRNWQETYLLIPQTMLYHEIRELFDLIGNNIIKCAIVSTSPHPYVEKLIRYYNMPIKSII